MDIGDRVKVVWHYYKEWEIGILDRYIESNDDRYIESNDEPGYWLVNSEGEEFEVLFQDVFRGEVTVEKQ